MDAEHFLFDMPQPCPQCNLGQMHVYLSALLGIPAALQAAVAEPPRKTKNGAQATALVKRFGATHKGVLTVSGTNGVGKSRIAASIVLSAYRAEHSAYYVRLSDLLNGIRAGYKDKDTEERWKQIMGVRVLAIDELMPGDNDWERRDVQRIITERYELSMVDCGTVFCTECDMQEFSGHAYSRLTDKRCTVVHLEGPDLRKVRE